MDYTKYSKNIKYSITMKTTAIANMYGQGQITLPKTWREKFHTKHFLLIVEDEQLIIRPIETKTKKAPKDKDLQNFYEALEDIRAGRVTTYDSVKSFEKAFDKRR